MEPGITVGVLHTGRHYPDDLVKDGIIYHYPSTQSPGKDRVEEEATKNAATSGLPIFVVTQTGTLRDVHFGWIEDWDDTEERFLISFGIDEQLASQPGQSDQEWIAIIDRPRKWAEVTRRERDPRFAFRVLKRYANACAVCDLCVKGLIDAADTLRV